VIVQPGTCLGPYEIAEALGSGGMGDVYRARDSRLGRSVAIKIIQSDVAADRERLARFQREARLASSLNHPNIVTIFDFASDNGTSFIAMELVAGQSLRARLQASPMSLKEVIAVATQFASGLAAAHRAGVVHRDLKPENVMLTPDGSVKILDFGLAKATDSIRSDPNAPTQEHLTRGHSVVGTAAYMSPEQTRGEAVDFRSDQFSFGVIVYEMVTGQNPFLRANTMDTLAAIGRDEVPHMRDTRPESPEALAWIVERCLEKNPERRYGSTDDLGFDLARVREQGPGAASGMVERRPAIAWWLAATALVAVALLAALLVVNRHKDVAHEPIYTALHIPEVTIPRSSINSPIAISPDGRRIAIAAVGRGDEARIWLRELSATVSTPIAGTEGGYSPAWSPDGKQIAFFANGKLKTVPVTGGSPHVLCDAFSESSITWSADGTIVFAQINSPDGPGLFKIAAAGGTPVRLTRPNTSRGEFVHLMPEFLPDGKRFLFISYASALTATANTIDLMLGSTDGTPAKRIGPASSRAEYHGGSLYFVRDASLLAQRFDTDTLAFIGEPAVVANDVEYVRDSANAGFSVAENGTVVYRSGRAESRLLITDSHGLELVSLGYGLFNTARAAPDGSRIAVAVSDRHLGTSDLWMYDLSGRAPSRVTFETWDERAPVWSADGHSLFYSIDIQGPPDIFRFDVDRSRREPVLMDRGRQDPLDVSPDGRTLLYQDFNSSRGNDLRSIGLERGAKSEVVVATPFDEREARFSPDGTWISFSSDVSGQREIYVTRFPARAAPIRVSTAGGSVPRWSGDGHSLTYLAPSQDMMSVSLTMTADAVDVGAPRFLFRTAGGIETYEVTRDGRFVIITGELNPAPPVQLVLR
jgi:eukaryotic-like serine/threonine-protein kinase